MQINNLYELYKPTELGGKIVYPAYLPGLEDSASSLRGTVVKASGWTQLVVYKMDKLNPDFDPYRDITLQALEQGNHQDPGGVNANKADLTEYVRSGGKAIV